MQGERSHQFQDIIRKLKRLRAQYVRHV